jgi:hypothetical protein
MLEHVDRYFMPCKQGAAPAAAAAVVAGAAAAAAAVVAAAAAAAAVAAASFYVAVHRHRICICGVCRSVPASREAPAAAASSFVSPIARKQDEALAQP